MEALVVSPERRLVVQELDEPEMLAGTVRLLVDRCGICGSDLHLRHDETIVPPGAVLGHEIVGSVIAVGEGVTDWTIGQRVASYHAVSCGECERCLTNRPHMCAKALQLSLGLGTVQGGYAQRIVVPEILLHAIPDHVSFDEAALTEPLAIGLHGVQKAHVQPGEEVCILGAGPIGVMAAWALRTRGVDNVVLVDPNPHRRSAVQAMGFSAVELDSAADGVVRAIGRQPQVVIEASGHVTSPGLAVELVGPSGRVVLQGRPPAPVAINQRLVVSKEVSVVGAVNCTVDDFAEALGHISTGKLEMSDLITDVIPLDEADAMFDKLLSPAHTSGKVLLAP